MEIRFAVEDDYRSIEQIAIQGQHYHVNLRPDIYLESSEENKVLPEEQYRELISNHNMIVCTDHGRILAYMAFEDKIIANPLMKQQKTLFIDGVAVEDDNKQKGISKMMMSWIKQYARDHNYEKIELQVNYKNEIAKQLYINQGFKSKSINMEFFLDAINSVSGTKL